MLPPSSQLLPTLALLAETPLLAWPVLQVLLLFFCKRLTFGAFASFQSRLRLQLDTADGTAGLMWLMIVGNFV